MGKDPYRPRLADGFSQKLTVLVKEHYSVLASGLMPEQAQLSTSLAVQLRTLMDTMPSPIFARPAVLPHLKNNFESFRAALVSVYALYRSALEQQEIADEGDQAIIAEALATEDLFHELCLMEQSIDTRHSRLQAHFLLLYPLFYGLKFSRSKLVKIILELEQLRNSFFEEHEPQLLKRYLELAAQVSRSSHLAKLLHSSGPTRVTAENLRTDLLEAENRLQVAFMLETKL